MHVWLELFDGVGGVLMKFEVVLNEDSEEFGCASCLRAVLLNDS